LLFTPTAARSGGAGAARKGKNKGKRRAGATGGERGWLMDD